MISIIICSIKKSLREAITKNIEATIGNSEYEIFIHNNIDTNWGLAKVYNHYAQKSNGEILCFFHEDIRIHTNNWGNILVSFYLANQDAGVIGFAGSILKTKTGSGWDPIKKHERVNLIQHYRTKPPVHLKTNPNNEDFSRVVVLDGLCLISPKKIWNANKFDEILFDKFNLYDLDFSFQIALNFKNYVCHTIDLEHYSMGSFQEEWFHYSTLFHKKWNDKLPIFLDPITNNEVLSCEAKVSYNLAKNEIRYMWSKKSNIKIYLEHYKRGYSIKNNFKLIKYLITGLINKKKAYL